ncbi:DUF4192 family protein [uncultured Microbacterium sp.]|uniref:DUF4192 family protein n=1 Tax=uncultured Microbacterium sp. TaxID=191216 RepID=UPI0025FF6E09|nr:DUF4192 family protein [uncultured Microbacterium sp.]
MTTTVVRATSPSAFLSIVPHLLECTPRQSLVIVPFDGTHSLGAMRVDLPPEGDAVEDGLASTVIGMACKVRRTDGVAVVVYADVPLAAGLPHLGFVDAVRSRAQICGLRLVDAFVVGSDGWARFLDPATIRPLDEITAHPTPVVEGVEVHPDQTSAAALPEIDRESARAFGRLVDDVEVALVRGSAGRRVSPARRARIDEAVAEIGDPPALFERIASVPTEQLDLAHLAALGFCLERPALRDVALVQWATDLPTGDAVLHAQTAYRTGTPIPADLARPLYGEGARPDPSRLRAGLDACRRVAALTPDERRPGPLAACAWLAWAGGRASHAAAYAEQALRIDSAHGLSEIVLTLVSAGQLPEWVYERPTSPAGTGSSRGSRDR